MDKDGDFLQNQPSPSANSARFRGIVDFLLIIRDRWLWGLSIALPVSLIFAFKQLNVDKLFSASASLNFELPKKILDLTPVQRTDFSKQVLGEHVQRLRSKEFRDRLMASFTDDEKEKLLSPYRSLDVQNNVIPTIPQLIRYNVIMGGTHIPTLTITATSLHTGDGASVIANKVQNEYLRHIKSTRSQIDSVVISKLRDQLNQMSEEEKSLELELEKFRGENDLVSIQTARDFIVTAMTDLKNKISSANIEKLNNEVILLQIKRQQADNVSQGFPENTNLHLINEVSAYGSVQQYRSEISSLKRQRKNLEEKYLERHPAIIRNLDETLEYETLLATEISLAELSFVQNVTTAIGRISNFNKELEKQLRKSQDLDSINIGYRVIEREGEAKTALRQSILKRINDIEVLQEIEESDSTLTAGSPAGTPMVPISPNSKDIISKSFGVFFMAFILIPIGMEFLDNRVKSPWDIEVFIGREMLAGIPRISLVSETNRPLIVAQDLDESLVESFRGLYSRIQMNSDNIYPKSILVTSAIPSEGKSLLAANLAHSFANHGRKTLLMDFDLRRPGLHKFCGLSNDSGLLSFVQELQANPAAPLNMDDIPEVYPNLRLLPSGGKTRTATELLEKMSFTNLLIKLKREFDVLLIDSSPVGLFPDSNALATKVDDLIFVTRYSKVGRRTAKTMLEKLEETGARILGVVLNDLPEKKSSSYYYNYGYYGYGYGYYRYKYYSKYYGDSGSDTMAKQKETRKS